MVDDFGARGESGLASRWELTRPRWVRLAAGRRRRDHLRQTEGGEAGLRSSLTLGYSSHRMDFDWDSAKAERNVRKHGVSFAEASTAFSDPLSVTIPDPDHSENEARFLLVGQTETGRLVVVSHVERDETLRIVSARLATRHERRAYEEG